jgi:ZIP family zinc transporter
MNTITWVIIVTSIAGVGGTGFGGILGAILKRDSKKIVSLLLSFAGGVMLAVVCFDLVSSAIFPDNATEQTNIFIVIAGILLGFMTVYVLNYFIDKSTNKECKHIDKEHPKTADSLEELIHSNHYVEHKSSSKGLFTAGIVMAYAIALHNLPEGMVIGASFASTQIESGIIIAIIIGLHNLPEGMAISVPLICGGMSRLKAIITTALAGVPTILGAIVGYYLGSISPMWLAISLSFASGAMLYVVFGELLPESILMWKSKLPAIAVLVGMILGLIIIYV